MTDTHVDEEDQVHPTRRHVPVTVIADRDPDFSCSSDHEHTPADDLADIGFYTLSDTRAAHASASSPLSRCELILTGRCNFRCPYCRRVGGRDLPYEKAAAVVNAWADDNLFAIRFSGGEPTLYPRLADLVRLARDRGIQQIAVSSNGSADWPVYEELMDAGVTDWSVSLDACCAADGDRMAGNVAGAWDKVIDNLRRLAALTYTTVGVVLTADNIDDAAETIRFADSLGVSDIRVIPAAQEDDRLHGLNIAPDLAEKYPVLAYRLKNLETEKPVRGLRASDSHRCALVLDDMAVNQDKHFPCIIYMREGGQAIGEVGPDMRKARQTWYENHDTHSDPICSANCLDVCVDYNNKFEALHKEE